MKFIFKKGRDEDIVLFLRFFRGSVKDLFSDVYSANSLNYEINVDYSPRYLKSEFRKKNKQVFLCFSESKIVGYLLISRSIAGVGFADWLAVARPYQENGIASKLLRMWEKHELQEGSHSLFLWTTRNNLEFYRGRGFVVGGEFPKGWHGIDDYLIYKNLREPKEENYLKHYLKSLKTKR